MASTSQKITKKKEPTEGNQEEPVGEITISLLTQLVMANAAEVKQHREDVEERQRKSDELRRQEMALAKQQMDAQIAMAAAQLEAQKAQLEAQAAQAAIIRQEERDEAAIIRQEERDAADRKEELRRHDEEVARGVQEAKVRMQRQETLECMEAAERENKHAQQLLIEELQAKREEETVAARKREARRRLPRHSDADHLDSYLIRLEAVLQAEDIPPDEWHSFLYKALTGKAARLLAAATNANNEGSYTLLKQSLLAMIGLSRAGYETQIITLHKHWGIEPEELFFKIDAAAAAVFDEYQTVEELRWGIRVWKFLQCYTDECGAAVRRGDTAQMSDLLLGVREYERLHGPAVRRYRNPKYQDNPRQPYRTAEQYERPGRPRYEARPQDVRPSPKPYGEKKPYVEKNAFPAKPQFPKKPTAEFHCWNCGNPDHAINQCPFPAKVKQEHTIQLT